MISLTLPYPPSANKLWRAVQGRNIKSGHYREWLSRCVACIAMHQPEKLTGGYVLDVTAYPPDRRARDLDNLFKALNDALALAGVVSNDSKCRVINARWADEVRPHGELRVKLEAA